MLKSLEQVTLDGLRNNMNKDTVLIVHGVGEGFSTEVTVDAISKVLKIDHNRIRLFDYAKYLDSIIWPRYTLFPITMWAKKNKFADQVGDVTAWVGSGGARERIVSNLLKTILYEKPKYIVAHSLGSVIGYQALLKCNDFKGVPELDYNPIYVGLGSPLHLWTLRQLSGLNNEHNTHISENSVFIQGKKDPIAKWGKNPWKFLDNNVNNLGVLTPNIDHDLIGYLNYIAEEVKL
jgi:hypothetical protein